MKIHTQFESPTPAVTDYKEPLRVGIGGPLIYENKKDTGTK